VKPAVSVVIPLYNKEGTIARTIDSVLSQTISDFELIIAEGPSTDGSSAVVSSYHDPRIVRFTQEGHGVSAARNQAIHIASAELIAFLDADDQWMPDFLETVFHLHSLFPSAGMYGTGYSVFSEGKQVRNIQREPELGDRIFPSYFIEYVFAGHPIIITSAFAAPKHVLEAVGGYPEHLRVGEDHELFGKIALQYSVAYSPKICSRYNLGSENNADIVDFLLEVPLQTYLDHISMEEIRLNTVGLAEYLDHWKIRTGGRNIYSGFRKEGRIQIRSANTSKYWMLKTVFLLLSYVPFNLSMISSSTVRKILRMVNLSI